MVDGEPNDFKFWSCDVRVSWVNEVKVGCGYMELQGFAKRRDVGLWTELAVLLAFCCASVLKRYYGTALACCTF